MQIGGIMDNEEKCTSEEEYINEAEEETPVPTQEADTEAEPQQDTEPDPESDGELESDGEFELSAESEADEPEQKDGILNLFRKIRDKFLKFCNICGFPQMLLMRFLGVYMIVAGVNLRELRFKSDPAIDPINSWKDFVEESSLPKMILLIAVGFVLLTVLHALLPKKARILDQISLLGGTLFFGIVMMWRNSNFYVCLGMMAIAIVFTVYTLSRVNHEKIEAFPKWLTFLLTFIAAACVCGFVAFTTVYRHMTFSSSTYDFGIFVQMFHSLASNLTAVTTCERDEFLSHFCVHASFIYYVLTPVYALFPSEYTLLISQAVLAMGGIIPFYLILKNHGFKGLPQLAACFMYIFCAGIMYPCYYDFHENAFLPTLLMWLLYAVDTRKTVLFYIMSILTCIVKEDAPLYVICIALFYLFEETPLKKKLHALPVILLSGVYFVIITKWLEENGDGSFMVSSRFGILTIDSEDGFLGIIKNVLTDPAYFFSLFFGEESLTFFLQVFVPMAFLPFMTKKIRRYLLMIPFIIMNLVVGAGYGYACQLGYQYIFGPICLLLYMAILNATDFDKEKRNGFVFASASASIILLTSTISGNLSTYYNRYQNRKEYYQELEAFLDEIPEDAAVAVNEWYLPHIADRDEVYILNGNDLMVDPNDENNKILVDPTRYDMFVMSPGDENTSYFIASLEENGFTLYDEIEGCVIAYVSPTYSAED